MRRHFVLVVLFLAAVAFPTDRVSAASGSRVITRAEAASHGLARSWFTQIQIDPARASVTHLTLIPKNHVCPDTLFVQTDQAMVHAVHAETGQTLWARTVGQPTHPSMAVGANDDLVAVINGTTLYVLRRTDGKVLWKSRLDGVPAAGAAMSSRRAFVPMLRGRLIAYRLKKEDTPNDEGATAAKKPVQAAGDGADATAAASPKPESKAPVAASGPFELQQKYIPTMACVSFGHVTSQPIIIQQDDERDVVAWTTTKGLFVGRIDQKKDRDFDLEFQVSTAAEIASPATFLPPGPDASSAEGALFCASADGQIYATSAQKGDEIWRYAIGEPILEVVVPIERRLYVATQLGGMYCLKADSGAKHWWTGDVTRFIAAGKQRIYAVDRAGDLRVLDANNGAPIDTVAAADCPLKYLNMQTDRIYLATPSGLVQCLREVELVEPLRHYLTAAPKAQAPPKVEPQAPEPKAAQPAKPKPESPKATAEKPVKPATPPKPKKDAPTANKRSPTGKAAVEKKSGVEKKSKAAEKKDPFAEDVK